MLTESLAKFVVKTGFADIPGEEVKRAKQHVLDGLGVMLAGSQQDIGLLIIRFVEKMAAAPEAHVVGGGFRTSAPLAVLANGTTGHALGFDDDHEIAAISLEDVYQQTRNTDLPDADAVFISCTNLRTLPIIEDLETDLKKPVISAIQASLWYALKVLGIHEYVPGTGSLFLS